LESLLDLLVALRVLQIAADIPASRILLPLATGEFFYGRTKECAPRDPVCPALFIDNSEEIFGQADGYLCCSLHTRIIPKLDPVTAGRD
jgi:hypothetical protein